jgi:hypothetical protein
MLVAGACVVVAGGVVLVRPPASPGETQPAPDTIQPVRMVPVDQASGGGDAPDEFSLRDPIPLYLPTSLNAGQIGALGDDGRREPVAAFRNFPASLVFPESSLRFEFPASVRVPAGMPEAIDIERGRHAFKYLGRRHFEVASFGNRFGLLEAVRAGDGQPAFAAELGKPEGAPEGDWGPVSMMVAVNEAGLVGLPFVTQSSGSAQVDAWLPTYLAGPYRLGQRLSPGIYRISLGP